MVLPESCMIVWKWFIDLHNARTSNGFGINPISYMEIKAYFDLIDIQPQEWEISLIKRFDNEVLMASAKQLKESQKKQSKN